MSDSELNLAEEVRQKYQISDEDIRTLVDLMAVATKAERDCNIHLKHLSACTKIFSCITIDLVTTTFSALSLCTDTVLHPSQLKAARHTHAMHTRCKQRDSPFAPKVP